VKTSRTPRKGKRRIRCGALGKKEVSKASSPNNGIAQEKKGAGKSSTEKSKRPPPAGKMIKGQSLLKVEMAKKVGGSEG